MPLAEHSSQTIQADSGRIALIVHAFYADEFAEILKAANDLVELTKLFVTTSPDKERAIRHALGGYNGEPVVKITENRGRDILPFLRIYPDVKQQGFGLIAKVHTKRSLHLKDGDAWRREMIGTLLARDTLFRAMKAFDDDHSLGVVGPSRQFVRLSDYMGTNNEGVQRTSERLGLPVGYLANAGFFAGTMFVARTSALDPVVNLGFTSRDFPDEAGQVDGTLAHVLERCMTFGAIAQGMRIATVGNMDAVAIPSSTLQFTVTPRGGRLRAIGRKLERAVRLRMRGRSAR